MEKDNKNLKKPNIQKTILKTLANRPVISLSSIKQGNPKSDYAITRSVKNLVEAGCLEIINSDNQKYLKLTPKGKSRLNYYKIDGTEALVSSAWDGFWRIIILDIPEKRKHERESLRYLLKKANFVCIKNTVWISPFPYENLFINIKKDLNLGTELMILVTEKIDEETRLAFFKALQN